MAEQTFLHRNWGFTRANLSISMSFSFATNNSMYIQTDNDYSFNIVLGVSILIFIDCNTLTKYIYIWNYNSFIEHAFEQCYTFRVFFLSTFCWFSSRKKNCFTERNRINCDCMVSKWIFFVYANFGKHVHVNIKRKKTVTRPDFYWDASREAIQQRIHKWNFIGFFHWCCL